MPKVSEAHLAARRAQILDAARSCFVREGFHVTSMQDVIAEAGLSVGAVYRYFKSKNEIIDAIAAQYSETIGAVLEQVVTDPARPLIDAMSAAFDVMDETVGPDGPLRIAVQVWAEALRDEKAAELAERFFASSGRCSSGWPGPPSGVANWHRTPIRRRSGRLCSR